MYRWGTLYDSFYIVWWIYSLHELHEKSISLNVRYVLVVYLGNLDMCIYISKASETVCTACSALTLILLKWMIFHLGYWLYFAVIRWPVFCQKCMTRHAHMDLRLTLFMESLPLLRAAMISLGEYYVYSVYTARKIASSTGFTSSTSFILEIFSSLDYRLGGKQILCYKFWKHICNIMWLYQCIA